MKPGKEIGEMLNTLLQLVLDNPEYNNEEMLKLYVKESGKI